MSRNLDCLNAYFTISVRTFCGKEENIPGWQIRYQGIIPSHNAYREDLVTRPFIVFVNRP